MVDIIQLPDATTSGIRKLESFFNQTGNAYLENIEIIMQKDFNEAVNYENWLLNKKIPVIKCRIKRALLKVYIRREVGRHVFKEADEKFKAYEGTVNEEFNKNKELLNLYV